VVEVATVQGKLLCDILPRPKFAETTDRIVAFIAKVTAYRHISSEMLPFMNNQNIVRAFMVAGLPLPNSKRLVVVILFWLSVYFLAFGAFQLAKTEKTATALFLVFLVLMSVWFIWLGISLLRAKASQS